MEKPAAWAVRHEALQADCKVFQVFKQVCQHPHDGREGVFFTVRCADWVMALPVTAEGKLVLVRQYRFGAQALSWEPPGGIVDPGEDPVAAAERELTEETGYCGTASYLGGCSPNPAIFNNRAHFVLVENCTLAAAQNLDANEELEVGCFTPREAERMALAGEIHHALALTALFYLRAARPGLF